MSKLTLKEVIEKNKNPEMFEIRMAFSALEKELTKNVEEKTKQLESIMKMQMELVTSVISKMELLIPKVPSNTEFVEIIKPLVPSKITDEELLNIIKPLIPTPIKGEDGKTPTKEELLSLIRPLIPTVKDGETPSDERLLGLITTLIPTQKEITGEEIADKLNTLEEKVNISVIKDLQKTLEDNYNKLQKMIKGGGGGGMGDVINESFSVSSATTTISLSNNVAANSKAIWAYYNGQLIVKDTHYTISGKTITLSFTPQDSTNIDIIYIRR